jgi:hypothetical protein
MIELGHYEGKRNQPIILSSLSDKVLSFYSDDWWERMVDKQRNICENSREFSKWKSHNEYNFFLCWTNDDDVSFSEESSGVSMRKYFTIDIQSLL